MLRVNDFYSALSAQGIRRYCGVPDSTLNDFAWFLSEQLPARMHRVCPNEGNAIALAAGQHLGSGELSCVYMQNSGLGNAVNPLASLADPEVYGIPMLLIIGWRGVPGQKDEPQHVKQGRITLPQLDVLEVPYWVLPEEPEAANRAVVDAVTAAKSCQGPAALVVKPGTFAAYARQQDQQQAQTAPGKMTRETAIGALLEVVGQDARIVSTTGKASRELYEQRQALGQGAAGRDFLTVGSMGHASHIALGLAETRPDEAVICLDGDGAALMHMGALTVIGAASPGNLVHVVINNGTHDSVGGLPTCGDGLDFVSLARVCGYRNGIRVASPEQLKRGLSEALKAAGPSLIEVVARPGARPDLGRPRETPRENKARFMAATG